mmetsp:Transcript_101451/g.232537  ORF Transcript_101451/g.232537 Transcript_101451/m.232537 type:complete len:101 (+) Transcript_101451:112-414(+)
MRCQVSGHHEGQTCEERARNELQIEAQHCPKCNAATVRAEGCREIRCPMCGTTWRWAVAPDPPAESPAPALPQPADPLDPPSEQASLADSPAEQELLAAS